MSSTQEVGDIFGSGKGPAQAMLRSPTVLIVAVGLWGMNLFFFKLFGIDYKYVLTYDLVKMEQQEEEEQERKRKQQQQQQLLQKQQQQQQLPQNDKENVGGGGGDDNLLIPMLPLLPYPSTPSKRKNAVGEEATTPSKSKTKSVLDIESDTRIPSQADSVPTTPGGTSLLQTTSTTAAIELQQLQHPITPQEAAYGLAITWFKLVVFSIVLLCLLHFTTHFWMDRLHRSSIGAVFSFYGAMLIYIFLPLQSNSWLRRAFVMVLQRSFELINPRCSCIFVEGVPRRIPFVDVFYADAMCSLSKVFFDWGMLLQQAAHFPDPVPATAHNIVLPSMFAAVPFIIRARQCLIMYTVGRLERDPKKYQHLMNALKYSTSIFPLLLSAYQKTLQDPEKAATYEPLLLFLLTYVQSEYTSS
jgi:hypothetical protein